jgi:hypothetical protein
VPRFQDLREDQIGKDDNRFERSGAAAQLAPDEHIGAGRQVMPVPFDDGQRHHAHALRLFDSLRKIIAG